MFHAAVSVARRALSRWQDQLYKSFIPNTKDVTSDYWEWLRWRLMQVGLEGGGPKGESG